MLTDTAIRKIKPSEKPVKLADGQGLHLLVTPAGGKLWRFRYRHAGTEKMLALGAYPHVTLAEARERRDAARKMLANGIDPSEARKETKREEAAKTVHTFETLAREWMATRGKEWTSTYAGKTESALKRHAFPALGGRPIAEITAPEVLAMLRAIELRGTVDMAHRIQQHCGAIFRFAIATGRAVVDPVPSLKGALSTVKQEHFAALTDPVEFAALLRDIDAYRGEAVTKAAMQLLALTFQRTKEVRYAEWGQFDLEASLWRIPAEVMKMQIGRAHV